MEHKNTQRLNITIPRKVMERLKDKPNKSAFIAEAIREKLDGDERRTRDAELARAYRDAAIEDKELIQEWDKLAGEGL